MIRNPTGPSLSRHDIPTDVFLVIRAETKIVKSGLGKKSFSLIVVQNAAFD